MDAGGMEIFRRARRAALAYRDHAGVQDIFWAPAVTGGKTTGKMSLRFNVRKKKAKSRLQKGELIPARIDGFRTDITEYHFLPHVRDELPYTVVRPLMGGLQVQSSVCMGDADWGTLGLLLWFADTLYGISNQHVFDRPAWEYGDGFAKGIVYQPKKKLGGGIAGTLSSIGDNRLDYRLVRVETGVDLQQSVNGIEGIIDGYVNGTGIGERKLVKSGAASAVTRGMYDGRSLIDPHRVSIRSVDGSVICRPGDSGSIWLDEGGGKMKMFALHHGGDEEGRLALATLYSSIHSSVWQQLRAGKV